MKNNLPAGVRILPGVLSVILCIALFAATLAAYAMPTLFVEMGVAGTALRQVLVLVGSVSIGVTVLGLVLIIGGIVLGSILKKRA